MKNQGGTSVALLFFSVLFAAGVAAFGGRIFDFARALALPAGGLILLVTLLVFIARLSDANQRAEQKARFSEAEREMAAKRKEVNGQIGRVSPVYRVPDIDHIGQYRYLPSGENHRHERPQLNDPDVVDAEAVIDIKGLLE